MTISDLGHKLIDSSTLKTNNYDFFLWPIVFNMTKVNHSLPYSLYSKFK